ncbi:Ribonuclease [Actinidia chinensis var. chinensis]|uniref:Ribonuclease n=1 Tax=Actinidia chinensis var. chinensis TaxID=1590841 RepID=A0A2R6S1E2_ACTCC|nr:Ribonuclease [Actinidia chinensis var. chinensis]
MGEKISLSYKLAFPCTNNEVEYEALILGLYAAERRRIRNLKVRGDSKLVVRQSTGEFFLRQATLASYRAIVQKLIDKFDGITFEHALRSYNQFPDALAILGSKFDMKEDTATIVIQKKIEPSNILGRYPENFLEDWRGPIVKQLKTCQGTLSITRIAWYIILHEALYYRTPGGTLAQEKMKQVHEQTCGDTETFLYHRMQRQGYYWPEMLRDGQSCRWDAQGVNYCSRKMSVALSTMEEIVFSEAWEFDSCPCSGLTFFVNSMAIPHLGYEFDWTNLPLVEGESVDYSNDGGEYKQVEPNARILDLEALGEKKDKAVQNLANYHESLACAYNQMVVKRKFSVGDLMWKTVDAIMMGQSTPKLAPKWEGPYEVVEANSSGYYRLLRCEDEFRTGPINVNFIKRYCV